LDLFAQAIFSAFFLERHLHSELFHMVVDSKICANVFGGPRLLADLDRTEQSDF
jgi:hypothetical protein